MRLSKTLECGGLTPLCSRASAFDKKAASGRRTPRRRLFLITSFFLCGVLISTATASQLQRGSLCESTEKIVFNCSIEKANKIVSLCSSKELTNDRGYLQYRFGLPGKIELEFPKQREQTQSAFKYSHYFRAQFDQTEISFTSNNYNTRSSMISTASKNPLGAIRESELHRLTVKKRLSPAVERHWLTTRILQRCFPSPNSFPRKVAKVQRLIPVQDDL